MVKCWRDSWSFKRYWYCLLGDIISKFLPYGKQTIDDEDIYEVVKTLKSDFITQGPKIEEFEKALAKYCGTKYAVAFNSGTSALHGAYFALGLSNGDEMITSPNTFVASSNAGLYLGANVKFLKKMYVICWMN